MEHHGRKAGIAGMRVLKNFSRLLLNYAMVIENEIAWHVNGILSQFLI